jgi:hypothetical protein
MLYFQLSVAPTIPQQEDIPGPKAIANVMVQSDDITSCTDKVVQYLNGEHWEVVDVRNARLAETPAEFAYDKQLQSLYFEAEENGLSCLFTLTPEKAS